MFGTDKPINSYKEDILERNHFAKSLAKAMLDYKLKDSICIGLYGEWGSGKTSIINMALEQVYFSCQKEKSPKTPIIVKFNPWYFSDQNQLISQFFKELYAALKKKELAKKHIKLGQTIQKYANFFEPLILIPMLSTIGVTAKAIKDVGVATEKAGEYASKDLSTVKKELNSFLEKIDQKIFIIIDDIDRLNNFEIRQIFQLVKSLADFSNTIYLLSFDKNIVINALQKVQEGTGSDYLEKVVQVPFDVPIISNYEVESFLFQKIDELIKEIPDEEWDSTYWGNIYHSGIRHFINNIRDVNRYINVLGFGLNLIKNEVNAIDFLAITVLQVFLPDLYYEIRDNKELFSGVYGSTISESIKNKDKELCDKIISISDNKYKEILKDFIPRLFPKLKSHYGNIRYSYSSLDAWRKERRICSPEKFELFFRLSIPSKGISRKEMENILTLGNNIDQFSEALLKLNAEGKISTFLDSLEDYTRTYVYKNHIENIITALMNLGDLFPEGDGSFFGFDVKDRIIRISHQLINRFNSHEKRFEIIRNAFVKAEKSLFTILNRLYLLGQEHNKYRQKKSYTPLEETTITLNQVEKLEKIALEKIMSWVNEGKLLEHRYLVAILYDWKRFGGKKEMERFVNHSIKSNDSLTTFLTAFLSKSKSHGLEDYVSRENYYISLKNIKDFVQIEKIETRIRKIHSSKKFDKLEKIKRSAITTFLDTIDGKIEDRF
jgi:predicted KAP-like P-loop ATPase